MRKNLIWLDDFEPNNDKIDLEKAKNDFLYFAKKILCPNIKFTEYQLKIIVNIDSKNNKGSNLVKLPTKFLDKPKQNKSK